MYGRLAVLAAALASAYVVAERPDLLGRVRAAADRVAAGLRGTITVFADNDGDGVEEEVGSYHWDDSDLDAGESAPRKALVAGKRPGCACGAHS